MPQAKRKRKTKHRGNAAGVVEARGRTGRKPTAEEKSPRLRENKQAQRAKHADRYEKEPTWKGATYRALAAALVMFGISLWLIKKPGQSFVIFPIVLLLYIPISYYTDLWMYRRRQRSKAKQAGKASTR
ncbi:MAG TPA: hypothetical protein VGF95_08155 [Solirubrobacteraceae bacterium]